MNALLARRQFLQITATASLAAAFGARPADPGVSTAERLL